MFEGQEYRNEKIIPEIYAARETKNSIKTGTSKLRIKH
ncbi:hypothetical protein JCM19239_6578 [Vibrio variabilis]|uniref:Uncharacterized protein n=1 Tax=Vibrio variabilis TaxID=990271 RepID=A0ABQ0JL53_9VIBR|nr:hypothetical protein JCM19239_6578 [Vibrio variabilis]